VSFSVETGETFGIIGSNGSGKSTSLKLVARTMNPTGGNVTVDGRVAALLELGAGFHPDLTGRENVYLNASFLGLSKAVVDRRLDEIVDFAGLADFIDVPIKHYSSGMHVRLGFAVAINVDADLLLIDEVLAVGDEQFQRKCMDRLGSLQRAGCTIVFVSHGLGVVSSFCTRVAWIDHGRLRAIGPASQVVAEYLTETNVNEQVARANAEPEAPQVSLDEARWRHGNRQMEITRVQLLDGTGQPRTTFVTGEPFRARISYRTCTPMSNPLIGVAIHTSNDVHLMGRNTKLDHCALGAVVGEGCVEFAIDRMPLLQGSYLLSVSATDWNQTAMYDYHDRHYEFRVFPSNPEDNHGVFLMDTRWTHLGHASNQRPGRPVAVTSGDGLD
jgi:ABC-type polysaccharide/polyol phosphate transport system ATPase subunit